MNNPTPVGQIPHNRSSCPPSDTNCGAFTLLKSDEGHITSSSADTAPENPVGTVPNVTTTKQTGYVSQLRIDRVKRSATANNAAAFTPTIKPLPARTAPKPPTKTLEMSVAPLDASGRFTDDHTLKTAQLQPGTYLDIITHDNGVTATPTTDPKAPAKVDNRGRIHLSPAIRKNQNWLKGTRLLIQSAPNYITITRAQTITD